MNRSTVEQQMGFLIRSKSAELGLLRIEACRQKYKEQIAAVIDGVIEEQELFDMGSDFHQAAWKEETAQFAIVSYEHLIFGKAADAIKKTEQEKELQLNINEAKENL